MGDAAAVGGLEPELHQSGAHPPTDDTDHPQHRDREDRGAGRREGCVGGLAALERRQDHPVGDPAQRPGRDDGGDAVQGTGRESRAEDPGLFPYGGREDGQTLTA